MPRQYRAYVLFCGLSGLAVASCPIKAGQFEDALALYQGEFLKGFYVPDVAAFEEWATTIREQAREQAQGAFQSLVAEQMARQQDSIALQYARQWIALEPLDERGQLALLRLLVRSGQRAQALAQYEAYRQLLVQELNIAPSPEAQALQRAIQSGTLTEPDERPHALRLEDSGVDSWDVFVGREQELARLEGWQEQALQGNSRVVFVTGEAGSGKASLLRAFARRALEKHPDLLFSANQEALSYFSQAIELLRHVPHGPARQRQELSLQLALATSLQALKGYFDPQVRETYDRVRELSNLVGEKRPLLPSLYYLRTTFAQPAERQARLDFAKELIDNSANTDPTLVCLAHWVLGLELTYLGEFERARAHLDEVVATHDSKQNQWLAYLYGHDIGVASRARLSWVLWFLGYPEQAERYGRAALELARELGNSMVLGFAIGIAGVMFNQLRGDVSAVAQWHRMSTELSRAESLALFSEPELFTQGWIFAETGQVDKGLTQMSQSLQALRVSGTGRHRTYHLGLLAAALGKAQRTREALDTIDQALAEAETNWERYYQAELYRLKGELLQTVDREAAEANFSQALHIARRQHAKMWELRALVSLYRLRQLQGKQEQAAFDALKTAYQWFDEGLESPDLQEAARYLKLER